MAITPTYSGTYAYAPSLAEIAIDAFERCQLRATELTPDHWLSMRRSMNLVCTSWSNRGVNLWLVDTQTVNLSQGVATYSVPTDTVEVEEAYLRTYQMGQATDVTPDFSTTSASATVTINQPGSGAVADGFISIDVPVSVGGIVLSGFYEVQSIPTADTYTITAADLATATASGGAVPLFNTVAQSAAVTVDFDDHGLLAGQPFVVGVATYVGGITLQGTYTVASIVDPDTFTIAALQTAGATDSAFENGGQTQIAVQSIASGANQPYFDITLVPFSRVDYSNLPNKLQQGRPSQFYYDRLISPTLTLWLVPDDNGPYQLLYNRVTQPQDCDPRGSQKPYLPYRALESFHADIAAHFAMKWNQSVAPALMQYAEQRWSEFAMTDSENKPTMHILPQLDGYYRP